MEPISLQSAKKQGPLNDFFLLLNKKSKKNSFMWQIMFN